MPTSSDIDFFGDDEKSDMHHPRPGSELSAQSARAAPGPAAAEPPSAKIGSAPQNAEAAEPAAMRSAASVPEEAVTVAAGGGGGGVPRAVNQRRPANLVPVSSAPATRSVIIRRSSEAVAAAPADAVPAVPRSPVAALAAPPPEFSESEGIPAPAGPPAPTATAPRVTDRMAPGTSGAARMPDSYRAGYAEYLRAADIGDLFIAALPGTAGIAGFTLVGAYVGYRQARALQKALLAPAPTRILL